MPEYTLKLRRYSPETGTAAYWEEFTIDLDGTTFDPANPAQSLRAARGEQA